MSRPKGSKNKPKEGIWESKENVQQDVSSVENLQKIESPKKIRSTISSSTRKPSKSVGVESVEIVSMPTGETPCESSSKRIIKGFVNIQQSIMGKKWYYTAGDIHTTEESAKARANNLTVATVYIAFEEK